MYRPDMGAAHGNSVHYQNISSQNRLGPQTARVQTGPANQFVLPPIAPRPSPPANQNGSYHSSIVDTNGLPTDQYGLFEYSFDGQTFAEGDIPPKMRQNGHQDYRHNGFQMTAAVEKQCPDRSESMHYPHFQNTFVEQGNGRDDMSHPAFTSEWPPSSTATTTGHFNHMQSGIIPTSEDHSPRKRLGSLPQALFPPHSDSQFPEHFLSMGANESQKAHWGSSQPHGDCHHFADVYQNSISPTSYQGFDGVVPGSGGELAKLTLVSMRLLVH